jgi:hypothetical protein
LQIDLPDNGQHQHLLEIALERAADVGKVRNKELDKNILIGGVVFLEPSFEESFA